MRKTELQINLSNLENNLKVIESKTSAEIQAVIKANAYGLDINEVCEVIDPYVESFAVITIDEALNLRKITHKPILILQGVHEIEDYQKARDFGLDFVIHSDWQMKIHQKFDFLVGTNRAWLKINTGMNRLGFSPDEFFERYQELIDMNFRDSTLIVMSHLASSSEKSDTKNVEQIELFTNLTKDLDNKKSLANSGAIFNFKESHFDIVRPGIAIYGGKYMEHGIKPVTCLRSKITMLKNIKAGESVGYDSSWVAESDCIIAGISIGYADGYPYSSESREVSINGKKFRTAGKINMDLITINLEQDSSIKIGDWVELWGFNTNLTNFSKELDSISYQLLTNISGRVNKNYLE